MAYFSLNLDFTDPTDFTSGGGWTVVAKVDGFGLSGASVLVTNVVFDEATGFLAPSEYEAQKAADFSGVQDIVIGDNPETNSPLVGAGVIGSGWPTTYVDNPNLALYGSCPDLGPFSGGIALATGTFGAGVVPDWASQGTQETAANLYASDDGDPISIEAAGETYLTIRYVQPSVHASLSVSLTNLTPTCIAGSNATSSQFEVRNGGEGTLEYTVGEINNWLSCTPTSGTSTGETHTITVIYHTSALAAGTYNGMIAVTAASATNSPQEVAVTLTVEPDSDGDGLTDAVETNGAANVLYDNEPTDPNDADSDEDELTDYEEIYTTGTNPNNNDTDYDGFDDYFEVSNAWSPTNSDSYITEYLRTNGYAVGLYTTNSIMDLSMGHLMLQTTPSNTLYLWLQLEQCTNLVEGVWTNAGDAVWWEDLAPAGKPFYRVRGEP